MARLFVVLIALLPCLVLAQVPAREASGVSTRGQDMNPAVVVARVCVKEAGFWSPDDCAAIRAVLKRVGRGDVVRGARIYSPRTFDVERLGDRPWIAYLKRDGSRPRLWPDSLCWSSPEPRHAQHCGYQAAWSALVASVDQWIEKDYRPCNPHHWGDRYGDLQRALSYGWERIDCGETLNYFWRNPRID